MNTTIAIAIIAIFVAGTVAALIPIGQVNAAPGSPKIANGKGSSNSDDSARNQGTDNGFTRTPANQPCSVYC